MCRASTHVAPSATWPVGSPRWTAPKPRATQTRGGLSVQGNPRGPTLPSTPAAPGLLRPLTPQRPGVAPAVEARARGLVTRSRVEGRGWPDRAVLPVTRRNQGPEVVIPVEGRVGSAGPSYTYPPMGGCARRATGGRPGRGGPRPDAPGATLPVGRRPRAAAVRRLGIFSARPGPSHTTGGDPDGGPPPHPSLQTPAAGRNLMGGDFFRQRADSGLTLSSS